MADFIAIMNAVGVGSKIVAENKELIKDGVGVVSDAVTRKSKDKQEKDRLRDIMLWKMCGCPNIDEFALMMSEYTGRPVVEISESIRNSSESKDKTITELTDRNFIEKCMVYDDFAKIFGISGEKPGFNTFLCEELAERLKTVPYTEEYKQMLLKALSDCGRALGTLQQFETSILKQMVLNYVFPEPVNCYEVIDKLPKIYLLLRNSMDKLAYAYMDLLRERVNSR